MKHLPVKLVLLILAALLDIGLVRPPPCLLRLIGRNQQDIQHIVLISIDTCRADYLSCYGFNRRTTPNIDAVAEKGIVFENVYSPVPITLAAHSSMLTGTIPPYHGVHDNLTKKLSENNVTLPEILLENGYRTAAVISATVLDSKFGLNQGFEEYQGEFTQAFEGDPFAEQKGYITSRKACKWLENKSEQPFFLFLHYYDPHITYQPPEPFASRFADNLYAGEIAYTDNCIGQVIDKLKTLNLYDSTLIIITSDHGEMLGEHGESAHDYFVYESAVRVPLIIKSPAVPGSRRISDAVGLIDIMPTVLSLLEIPPPAPLQGRDLGQFLAGNTEPLPRYIYTESLTATQYKCNPLLAVVNWPWKYIYTTDPELYHLQNDPHEKNNLVTQQSGRGRLLQKNLKLILDENLRTDQPDSKLDLDQETVDQLRSLGYVGSGVEETFVLDETRPDPKKYISFHERYCILSGAKSARKYEEGWKICTQLLRQRPDLDFLYPIAAAIAVKTNRMAEAVTHYQRYLQTNPANFKARNNLATALSRLGKIDQAIDQWQQVVSQDPDYFKAHDNLAIIFYKQRNYESAIKHWTEALRIQPDEVEILNNLAWMLSTLNNPDLRNAEKALRFARHACELTSFNQPVYLDTLAAAYAADGQFPNAVETAKKAIAMASSAGQNTLEGNIQNRLLLYQNRQPYREKAQPPRNTQP